MTRICIVSSHRAERGLLQPLIDRLKTHPGFDLDVYSLYPKLSLDENYRHAYSQFTYTAPEVVLIPCDRAEALAGALAAFDRGIPIIHFHAGDVGTVSSDEVHRHIISLMADVHLCNGPSAKKVVVDLLTAVGRSTEHVYNVGSTAMDDIEIDISLCPEEPFDLVLYHPPINDPDLINRELDEIEELLTTNIVYAGGSVEDISNRRVFWGFPNGDPGSEIINDRRYTLEVRMSPRICSFAVPRPKFLGLVKYCRRFIGNSSSMVCEAPMWLSPDQIIHIGDRNRNRSFDDIRPGGTDRIVKILEDIDWKNDFKTGSNLK